MKQDKHITLLLQSDNHCHQNFGERLIISLLRMTRYSGTPSFTNLRKKVKHDIAICINL